MAPEKDCVGLFKSIVVFYSYKICPKEYEKETTLVVFYYIKLYLNPAMALVNYNGFGVHNCQLTIFSCHFLNPSNEISCNTPP